ncbi:MAG: FecR domain-containing protein [Candidatus Riflebacteria bacterium]|nr:FecR domain-containing protein [Candidatus Riflebacteria bacterium]
MKLFLICLNILFSLNFFGCGNAQTGKVAELDKIQGKVEFRRASTSDFSPAKEKEPLYNKDIVKTGNDAQAILKFLDQSIVTLNKMTIFEVIAAENVLGKQNEGTAIYDMKKQKQETRVVSPHGTTAILGTLFCLTVNESSTTVWVKEGKVSFTSKAGGAPVIIEPGFKLVAKSDTIPTAAVAVDPFEQQIIFQRGLKPQMNR